MSDTGHDEELALLSPFPRNWLIGWAIIAALTVIAEFSYAKHESHVKYEDWFAFFGWTACCATAAISLTGLLLRPLLSRDRGYYDE